jgi:hypothetical protein
MYSSTSRVRRPVTDSSGVNALIVFGSNSILDALKIFILDAVRIMRSTIELIPEAASSKAMVLG